jgi:hypothetical protein
MVIRALMAAGGRHAILRFRANAARSAIALDTLPKVMALCFPRVRLREYRQDGFFALPNESQLWVGGLDEKERVEKILGTEFATIFPSECSQIPYASIIVVRTRLAQVIEAKIDGERFTLPQRAYYDLNPVGAGHWTNVEFGEKRDPLSRKPLANADNFARIQINPVDNRENLSADTLAEYEALPERHRKRFFEGSYVDEIEGALWTFERLEQCRCDPADVPDLMRTVVSVDPSGARGEEDKRSDEIGIIVAAKGVDGRFYVLEDASCRLGPAGWARRAVEMFGKWRADAIVAETNFGGGMVVDAIRAADANVRVREVHASRGKWVRAEPIAAYYEDRIDKARHVGRFPDLEDQLCKFSTAGYSGERSPDRADAMVWAAADLMDASWSPADYLPVLRAQVVKPVGPAPALPWQEQRKEEPDSGDLLAIYNRARKGNDPAPPACKRCGKDVGANRQTDGVDFWCVGCR